MEYLLLFCVLLLSVFGLCEILHLIKLRFIFKKRKMHSTLFLILEKDTAKNQLCFAGEQYFWLGTKYAEKIVAIGNGLDDETATECKKIAEYYGISFKNERGDFFEYCYRHNSKDNLS